MEIIVLNSVNPTKITKEIFSYVSVNGKNGKDYFEYKKNIFIVK